MRVSTANQEKGLEAQLRSLNECCKRMGITDFTIFTDKNQSGAKSSRLGLDAMMEAVRRGKARSVIVYSLPDLKNQGGLGLDQREAKCEESPKEWKGSGRLYKRHTP
jgi:DNA invertase Pin-like site-specific DNA recombinase